MIKIKTKARKWKDKHLNGNGHQFSNIDFVTVLISLLTSDECTEVIPIRPSRHVIYTVQKKRLRGTLPQKFEIVHDYHRDGI